MGRGEKERAQHTLLLAIGAYVRYAQRPDWRRYLLVAALFAAGLMAKPMVITLPFVLLLLDFWPLDRTSFGEKQGTMRGIQSDSNGMPRFAFSKLLGRRKSRSSCSPPQAHGSRSKRNMARCETLKSSHFPYG